MAYKIAAAIDIGSSAVRMEITEKNKSGIKQLEFLQSPLYLGHDTFTENRITFTKVEQLCAILNSYKETASQYGIENIKTVATTAFREAENIEYILDLIKLRTGIAVRVLDDPEEKTIIYREILRREGYLQKDAVISYVGTGSLGIAALEDGLIKFTQNIRIGSLKLSEILEPVEGYTKEFHMIIEQYISTYIDVLKNLIDIPDKAEFIASGKEIDLIASLMNLEIKDNFFSISKEEYLAFYDSIKNLTPNQISDIYNLSMDRAEILLPSAAVFKILMNFSKAEILTGCNINMCNALVYQDLYPNKFDKVNSRFDKSIINTAFFTATRFKYDKKHIKAVLEYSTNIFDAIDSVHGLDSRARIILQVACILHDCGKYINLREHYNHSYDLIKKLDLAGLNTREHLIIANVSKYHSEIIPLKDHANIAELTPDERVLVGKLSAILRLGDAMDKSHLQKFRDITTEFTDNTLLIKGSVSREATLEGWAFTQKAGFFTEVFGIQAKLTVERTI